AVLSHKGASMLRPMLSIVGLLAAAAACADSGPMDPVASAHVDAAEARADVTRPAGGTCVTTTQVVSPPPPALVISISGVCQLRHLGRATMEAVQVIDLETGAFTNTTTYTAANRDELYTSFAGQTTSTSAAGLTFTGTETFTGGTGRFRGASGTTEATGAATQFNEFGAGTGEYSMRGFITY